LSNLDEGGGADEHDVRDDDSRDGGGDAHARIAVRTGDAGRATAVEHPHQAAAGSQQDHERQEGAEGRPEAVVGGVEPGVAEQLARLWHGAAVLTAARHRHHAVAEKQRTGNEDRGDEDQDGGRHAVARLQTATRTRTHLCTVYGAPIIAHVPLMGEMLPFLDLKRFYLCLFTEHFYVFTSFLIIHRVAVT